MTVYYRKDRDAWCVEVSDPLGRRTRRLVKSEIAARALEASLRRSYAEQKAALKSAPLPSLKFSEAAELFLKELAASPSTRHTQAQRFAALSRELSDPKLEEITPHRLTEWQQRRLLTASRATTGFEAQLLYRLMQWAVHQGYLPSNPALTLDRTDYSRRSAGRELSQTECRKILAAVTPRIRLRLLLALDAGLRRGEIMRLRRSDWDKENRLIRVWRPKTRSTTIIPTTLRLADALQEIAGSLHPDSVINSWSGRNVAKGTDVLKKLRARTGISFRLHDLRHTFATRLRRVAAFDVVRVLLGHVPTTMTERYLHPSAEDLRRAIWDLERSNALTP